MSDTGKQSPLGINVLGSILDNTGFTINPVAQSYMGTSKTNSDYTFGRMVNGTCLRLLTWAIHDAYNRGVVNDSTYNDLISIGGSTIPALGNSKPAPYEAVDPSGVWTTLAQQIASQLGYTSDAPANTGYSILGTTNHGQQASWLPYTTTNPNDSITQWGYVRLHALQAWNEFNWNGEFAIQTAPEYKEFTASLMNAESYINYVNQFIISSTNSTTFLDSVYSNMDDLISADVTGVSLSTYQFGNDLVNLGNAINLASIESFGLPSDIIKILYENGALTQEIVFLLLSSGISSDDIDSIAVGIDEISISSLDQQKIYGCLLLITDDSLRDILAVLECKTPGLETLADLLDVRKLFPTSYQTLTVPIYNTGTESTNSKTYYLIYDNDGINSLLTSPAITEIIGPQVLPGIPPVGPEVAEGTNYYTLPSGFGSYLYNMVPQDIAVAAGAFSYSMRQIRNIKYTDIKVFAQAVKSIETVSGLPLVNGTTIPTNLGLANNVISKIALGSGPYGTFTMSDLFGCMSGLPYAWQKIYDTIVAIQTETLKNIYRELFLAVTWEGAQISLTTETREVEISPGVFQTEYRVSSFTIGDAGGGYGRGGAPAPTITVSNGATGVVTIGTNDSDAQSIGGGTFGRVTSVQMTSSGAWVTSPPTVTIQYPPTSTGGGTNTSSGTSGWPSMNSVVDTYITQAEQEIISIMANNVENVSKLNQLWNTCGRQLTIEQRTRYTAFSYVPIIAPESESVIRKDYLLNPYPSTLYTFIDTVPDLAQDTRPHMAAQTLEAISDLSTSGGQSVIGLMRESRNKSRLSEAGIDLDNTIPAALNNDQIKELTTNNTLADSNPAWSLQINPINGQVVYPVPQGIVTDGLFYQATSLVPGDTNTLVPSGLLEEDQISDPYIISIPSQVNPLIPESLDASYTSSTMLPASLSVQEAIDKVIKCNCDCWLN